MDRTAGPDSAAKHADERPGGQSLRIAIAGRGFSGLMAAIALLRQMTVPFELFLFDPEPLLEVGESVTGPVACEVLNSRVRDLSLEPGDPGDFSAWLEGDAEFSDLVPAAIPGFDHLFVPKSVFRRYVMQHFSRGLARRCDVTVRISQAMIADATPAAGGLRLEIRDGAGSSLDVTHLVLATGFGTGGRRRFTGEAGEPAERILIQGAGIRAVDRLLCLRDQGFAGEIVLLGEHRFLPQSHTALAAERLEAPLALSGNLRSLMRDLRLEAARAEASGRSWQGVLNALRPRAAALWSALGPEDRRRFARHVLPVYESHRNRLPPLHHQRLCRELQNPLTRHLVGHIIGQDSRGFRIRTAGGDTLHVEADALLDERPRHADLSSPLLSALAASGMVRPDELGWGLAADDSGQLVTQADCAGRLLGIGPVIAGTVPDSDLAHVIVGQAYSLAALLNAASVNPHAAA